MSGMALAQGQSAGAGSSVNRNLIEMVQRLDQMESEMRQLRGELEVLSHDMQGVNRRQREMYLDIDRRIRELELNSVRSPMKAPAAAGDVMPDAVPSALSKQPPATPVVPSATPTQTEVVDAPAVAPPSQEERDAYNRAFNLLKEGRYDQSIASFQSFMQANPKSSYADNAQYWLGEANYVSRKFKQAVDEFNKVIGGFPQSPKVADAMLKLGFTYYELADWKQARATLQQVLQQFPRSSAARLAETRLQRMSKEGH
jgi:tol-pal system protein YbgF